MKDTTKKEIIIRSIKIFDIAYIFSVYALSGFFFSLILDKISELKIENLNTVGILSQKGLFYLTEILLDAFAQARSLKISENKPKRLFTKVKRQNVNV